jgi:hypothetical protein
VITASIKTKLLFRKYRSRNWFRRCITLSGSDVFAIFDKSYLACKISPIL